MTLTFFWVFGVIAMLSALLCITRKNPVASALWLVVTLFSLAALFVLLDAQFIAVLQVLVYAGAIMVLFVFVLMMLDLRGGAIERERSWLQAGIWSGPAVLAAVLLGELLWTLQAAPATDSAREVGAIEVGTTLYGPYLIGVELAGFLLLGALVGAFHIGRRERRARRDVVSTTPSAPHDSGAEDGAC